MRIEPVWNLNVQSLIEQNKVKLVRIEPVWNLNFFKNTISSTARISEN
ncbi:MAG: hypothetical protein NZ923_10785 [Candidatus Kryptonium sp.]|nr:hypothetical protein [Candidatus Kryptonium sp.]